MLKNCHQESNWFCSKCETTCTFVKMSMLITSLFNQSIGRFMLNWSEGQIALFRFYHFITIPPPHYIKFWHWEPPTDEILRKGYWFGLKTSNINKITVSDTSWSFYYTPPPTHTRVIMYIDMFIDASTENIYTRTVNKTNSTWIPIDSM